MSCARALQDRLAACMASDGSLGGCRSQGDGAVCRCPAVMFDDRAKRRALKWSSCVSRGFPLGRWAPKMRRCFLGVCVCLLVCLLACLLVRSFVPLFVCFSLFPYRGFFQCCVCNCPVAQFRSEGNRACLSNLRHHKVNELSNDFNRALWCVARLLDSSRERLVVDFFMETQSYRAVLVSASL